MSLYAHNVLGLIINGPNYNKGDTDRPTLDQVVLDRAKGNVVISKVAEEVAGLNDLDADVTEVALNTFEKMK